MTRLSETRDVQDALVNHLVGIGWDYLPPDEILKARNDDLREPFLLPIVREQLLALNPGLVTEANLDDVLRRLRGVRPDLVGNEDFLRALRGHWTVYHPGEKRERNLTLIDYDEPARNRFTFTQEFPFEDRDRRRVDLLFFVNGLPLIIVENKSPTVQEPELEAFDQVQHTYTQRIPELLKFTQVFAACDLRIHYGATWNDSLKAFYRWKADGKDYAMYLDKPLKDHTLLQAIARVNRPYPDKESGLVVDSIGVFENLQRALAFDQSAIATGLIDLEVLKGRFEDLLLAAQATIALVNLADDAGRPARIVDHFFDEGRREAFVELFKELQTAYEILSPDPFLRDHLDDYALIVQVYQVVYNYFNPEAEKRRLQRELLRKTDAMIRQHVAASPVVDTLPLYPINRDIATVVKADDVSDRVRVTNLYRSLIVHVEQHQHEQPYLIPIGERVEAVIQQLRDRQIGVQTALEQLEDLTVEAVTAQEQQSESDLGKGEFALYWVLKGQGVLAPETAARSANRILAEHPGWPYNAGLERQVRRSLLALSRAGMV